LTRHMPRAATTGVSTTELNAHHLDD